VREPDWVFQRAAAPALGPCALTGSNYIGLAGCGVIAVTDDSFIVQAPTHGQAAFLWASLGDGARAKWWTGRGAQVLQGAVMAWGSDVVHITGASRMGASLTALGLGRRGWSLLCDGVVPILDGECVVTSPHVTIDAQDLPLVGNPMAVELPTARPRASVALPQHHDAAITSTLHLRLRVAPITPRIISGGDKDILEWGAGGDRDHTLANLPIRVADEIERFVKP
jgi:hypothetical protein